MCKLSDDFRYICIVGITPDLYGKFAFHPDLPPGKYAQKGKHGLSYGAEARHYVHIAGRFWLVVCWGDIDGWGVLSLKLCDDGIWRVGKPFDKDYFKILAHLCRKYGQKVVDDIWSIYHRMPRFRMVIDESMVDYISEICKHYRGVDQALARFAFFHTYFGFVAEDNKDNAYIGRLIKMKAILDFLIGGMSIDAAIAYTNKNQTNWRLIRDDAWRLYGLICPWANYRGCGYEFAILVRFGYRVDSTGLLMPVAA